MLPRILCFGDSLTCGYCGSKVTYCPYADQLSRRLDVPVDAVGMSGWTAQQLINHVDDTDCVDVFGKRGRGLGSQLRQHNYGACIIMAGTNDLGFYRDTVEIFADVVSLHRHCHAQGVRTVALSIPENRCAREASSTVPSAVRRGVNELLDQWAATVPDMALFVDIAHYVPFAEASGDWLSDGLHLSCQGSTSLGDQLAPLVHDFVSPLTPMPLSISAQANDAHPSHTTEALTPDKPSPPNLPVAFSLPALLPSSRSVMRDVTNQSPKRSIRTRSRSYPASPPSDSKRSYAAAREVHVASARSHGSVSRDAGRSPIRSRGAHGPHVTKYSPRRTAPPDNYSSARALPPMRNVYH